VALNADLVALPKRKFTARGVTASTRVEGKYNDSGGRLTAGPPANSASLTGVQLRSCGSSDTSSVRPTIRPSSGSEPAFIFFIPSAVDLHSGLSDAGIMGSLYAQAAVGHLNHDLVVRGDQRAEAL
jgi:hypothetical protein